MDGHKIILGTNLVMNLPHGIALKSTREKILTQAWTSYVKDEFDLAHLIQTKAQVSYAITVMDRIGGWIEGGSTEGGSQIGGRLAASIWIYTRAVTFNGQTYMDGFRNQKMYSILEAINWTGGFLVSPCYCKKTKLWKH